jgi:hypothetical protein
MFLLRKGVERGGSLTVIYSGSPMGISTRSYNFEVIVKLITKSQNQDQSHFSSCTLPWDTPLTYLIRVFNSLLCIILLYSSPGGNDSAIYKNAKSPRPRPGFVQSQDVKLEDTANIFPLEYHIINDVLLADSLLHTIHTHPRRGSGE